ncbi:hypothetical protein HOLleu_28925 [Holothuria leucospilota]|uniref:Uncharacterized protein n=1 Tax=Holothuria leucospilota TaxID=206669 RepID=A0A9Q1BMZ3_HOLLE|nr:hypothetical protein HOLleu_28925 [Holothuria leucospilota]
MEVLRKNVCRLVGIFLFVAVLGVHSQPDPEPEIFYLVTVPEILVAGSTELVLVKLHEPYEPVDVWVTLTLDDDVIAEESFVVTDEKKYPLKIPVLEACSTEVAQLTVHLKYQSAAAWVVNDERQVQISCVNSDTFVQTDKPIYEPRQAGTLFFISSSAAKVYRALAGQNGIISLYGDERRNRDRPEDIPFNVLLEFPEGCVCEDSHGHSLLKPDTPILVMDDGEDLTRDEEKPDLGHLPLGKDSAVILWSFSSRRATRLARLACPLS